MFSKCYCLEDPLTYFFSQGKIVLNKRSYVFFFFFLQEFARSGLQGANLLDAGKPNPETVLTSFMNNSEYDDIIANLNIEKGTSIFNLSPAEEAERIEHCIRSLSGVCGSVAFGKTVDSSGMKLKDNELIITSDVRPEGEEIRHGVQSTSQEVISCEPRLGTVLARSIQQLPESVVVCLCLLLE